MKRPCEDSSSAESDMEESIDVGRESIYLGHMKASFITCGSPTTTTQVMARKKRRGIIEKRRRDRINNSLLELRRLVPTAFEKQGSAKLEKAEILQMTVDHLKMYLDAHALALDFLSLGFRESLMEVSRYLSAVEGMDSGELLRARLLSHLASCASQRDAAALTAASPDAASHHVLLHHQQQQQQQQQHLYLTPSTLITGRPPWPALRPLSYGPLLEAGGGSGAPQRSWLPLPPFPPLQTRPRPPLPPPPPPLHLSCCPATPPPLSASLLSLSASFPLAFPILHPSASAFTSSRCHQQFRRLLHHVLLLLLLVSSQTPHCSSRPYRPWGTEVGAF
uniref:Hairy/enhancer-of-split related with YRPW motif 2 n=1 Tax=Salarias fasciatus TaxID=181472 RepID=A0A672H0A4_SALFA